MTRYREKSTEFEAFKIGDTWPDWFRLGVDSKDITIITHSDLKTGVWYEIRTSSGTIAAMPKDYITRGSKGEIYSCNPICFEKTYERVDTEMKTSDLAEEVRINGLLTMLGITANHELTEFEEVYAELKATLFKRDESHMKKTSAKGEPAIFPKTYTQGK